MTGRPAPRIDLRPLLKGDRLHGSAVAFADRGVLILGASGSGKSGLALQLLALGADLVADDQVVLQPKASGVEMRAPQPLAGLIEARNLGLIETPSVAAASLHLIVDLDKPATTRLPTSTQALLFGTTFDLICAQNAPNLAPVLRLLLTGAQKRVVD